MECMPKNEFAITCHIALNANLQALITYWFNVPYNSGSSTEVYVKEIVIKHGVFWGKSTFSMDLPSGCSSYELAAL